MSLGRKTQIQEERMKEGRKGGMETGRRNGQWRRKKPKIGKLKEAGRKREMGRSGERKPIDKNGA